MKHTTMDTLNNWLSLEAIPRIGINTLHKTAQHLLTSIGALREQSDAAFISVGWSEAQITTLRASHALAQCSKRWLEESPLHHFIHIEDPRYPALLKQIAQAPLFLFCKGDISLLNSPQLAVVGSRNASREGLSNVSSLVAELAQTTCLTITSGMALGVDAQSHIACLQHKGKTIAVLGCGIDQIYPKRHRQLYHQIAQQGLIVSEFAPSVPPCAEFFPRRNRIISGLSLGTLVAESAIKSGSLISARYANEQGREVFAIPGNIQNNQALGCHWLIKQGAKLVDCVADIVEEMPNSIDLRQLDRCTQKNTNQSLASDLLLDSVDFSATAVDVIATRTGMSIPALLSQLLEYELRGLVISTSEGYIKLRG